MAGERPYGPDTMEAAFVFVPHGDPPPTEWIAQHPGWVRIPATFVPHDAISRGAISRGIAAGEAWMADRDPAMDWLGKPVSVGAPVTERRPGRMMRGGIPPDRPGDLGEDPATVYLRDKEAMDRLAADPAFASSDSLYAGFLGGQIDQADADGRAVDQGPADLNTNRPTGLGTAPAEKGSGR